MGHKEGLDWSWSGPNTTSRMLSQFPHLTIIVDEKWFRGTLTSSKTPQLSHLTFTLGSASASWVPCSIEDGSD